MIKLYFKVTFTSQYDLKYTKQEFLFQLVWLLTNQDSHQTFENIAFNFMSTKTLNFDWTFMKPITIRAVVKLNQFGSTILRVDSVRNKFLPYNEISFSHPDLHIMKNQMKPRSTLFIRKVKAKEQMI